MYEAKFEKYKTNKNHWGIVDKSLDKSKTDFDKYTRGPDSWNIKAKTVKWSENDEEMEQAAFKP